jgi:MoaA/NifB/PqqE/SkfB family radical SAM enzyme
MAGTARRVLQIHPTRRCNLRCLHCYSSSGPEERDELDADTLLQALEDARAEGFTISGFSGGEPLLYKPLPRLLTHARSLGFITTVTSNGLLLDERRLGRLAGTLDLLAISLDGAPASHNRLRASDRAFEGMAARLDGVRRSGIPFGFIFTLTRRNVQELDWVASFALEQGARLLQIHPLEIIGRARDELPDEGPDFPVAMFASQHARRLQRQMGARLFVQVDLAPRRTLLPQFDRPSAANGESNGGELPLAELVAPLVVEADGTVAPLEYGFPRAYVLGTLREATLRELAARWRRDKCRAFHAFCRDALAGKTGGAPFLFISWHDLIAPMPGRDLAGRRPGMNPARL